MPAPRRHLEIVVALVVMVLAFVAPVGAQQPPGTDIYLVDLVLSGGQLRLGVPANITNRDGYDNQPSFTADGRSLLYTSIREDGQADIYRYDIESGATVRVTRTEESEYSPTIIPGGRGISVVRVEPDSTQRLWRFGLEGDDATLLLPEIRPVGYHAWVDANLVALFVLGNPATLHLADLRTGRSDPVVEGIGRSLHRIPGRNAISYLRRSPDGERRIEELDLDTRQSRVLVRPPGSGEDYTWTPVGKLLMGQGPKLFLWDPATGGDWREIADLSAAGISQISRLAVSPQGDRLAFVAAR